MRYLVFTFLALGCGRAEPDAIVVFAAASTRVPLEQVAADYQRDTGQKVECQFGASSDLARQLEQGAPADLFLPADAAWLPRLEQAGLVRERADWLTNRLAVLAPAGVTKLAELASVSRLALAGEAVPAGNYARAALRAAGVWEQVKERVVVGSDVRATLAYVERGEADAGIVYATDVPGRAAFLVPEELHPPIRYPLVVLTARGKAFRDYLRGSGAAPFRQAGFGTLR